MDISIIISGNLTGFSRFYASANANDIYNEAKFDFDYRNFLTFINAGEKAYAISFSPKVIAVSLITRILDSFRRPGILVVTALVPRYQLVAGTLNAQDKSAIYRLLNEINDKFYEKNFLNGMVNQNPAVLMQDYYSDILRNYALVSDRMQKAINTTIEVSSPNKRIGYVSSEEKDMPKYLSSLMRKSYSGYHHVFLADKAPANIDEPADEIVTYKVRVANDNRPITGEVRLDDRIPTVSPQQGEKPISNQNYTYRQVLNAEAGNEIMATLENDTIVLTYRFHPEEKTIYFKFYDGANEVPIHVIRPLIIESNGSSYPLSTDSWTFRGKEIYGLKTIKSGNSEYIVDPNSSRIDLQRLREGASHNIYVSKGWIWNFNPTINNRPVTIKPIDITLINKYTGEQRRLPRITGSTSERLSGTPNEWEMRIDSDYYESISVAATAPYKLNIKRQPAPANNGGNGTNVQRNGEGSRTHGNSSSNQGLKFTNGQSNDAKEAARLKEEQQKRYIKYGAYALVLVICFVGGWFGFTIWDKSRDKKDVVQPDSSWITNHVVFSLKDGSKNGPEIASDNLTLLDFTVSSNGVKIEDGENVYSKEITFDPKNSTDSIIIKVSFNKETEGTPIIFAFKKYAVNELREGSNPVIMSVKNSELDSYRSLVDGTIPSDLASQVSRLYDGDEHMKAYAHVLVNLKERIEAQASADAEKANQQAERERIAAEKAKEEAARKAQAESGTGMDKNGEIRSGLDDAGISLDMLNKITPQNNAEKKRISALRSVLGSLHNGKCPKNSDNLSRRQKQIVDLLIARNIELNALPATDPEKQSKLKDFSDGLKAKNDKGVNSIFTARAALKVKP